jgi:hypothetical protein
MIASKKKKNRCDFSCEKSRYSNVYSFDLSVRYIVRVPRRMFSHLRRLIAFPRTLYTHIDHIARVYKTVCVY